MDTSFGCFGASFIEVSSVSAIASLNPAVLPLDSTAVPLDSAVVSLDSAVVSSVEPQIGDCHKPPPEVTSRLISCDVWKASVTPGWKST